MVCFVLDASEPITELDKHVAGYAHNLNKPMIILLNKWDSVDKEEHDLTEFEANIREAFGYLAYAPILSVSAITKQRIHQIIPLINEVYQNASSRISTSVLNEILTEAIMLNPPTVHQGKRLKVYYMSQIDILPPTFILHINDIKLLHFSYQRYLENKIRDTFDFMGTSLVFKIKQK